MSVLGILTCEILELEFAYLQARDPDLARITVLEDDQSARLIGALQSNGIENLRRISDLKTFSPSFPDRLEVLINVLELALLKRVATIESVGSSTRIEGARLTDSEVEKLLSGLCIAKETNLHSGIQYRG